MTLTRSIPANAASRLRAVMEQADSEEGAALAAIGLVDAWRDPEPQPKPTAPPTPDQWMDALIQAWVHGGLDPAGANRLDDLRRYRVLAVYVRFLVEALELRCDHCGAVAADPDPT